MSNAAASLPDAIRAYADRSHQDRLELLGGTADRMESALRDRPTANPAQRPPEGWAPVEVVCHLRDIEDLAMFRFRMILQMDEPKVPAAFLPTDRDAWGLIEDGAALVDPVRWADERQYLRNDVDLALQAFRQRRTDTLAFVAALRPGQLDRRGIHPAFGPLTMDAWLAVLAWHDDNHVAQLQAALDAQAANAQVPQVTQAG
jgi:hypothetical protein